MTLFLPPRAVALVALSLIAFGAFAATPGDEMIANYFRAETAAISARNLVDIKTLDEWNAKKVALRQQLAEMLGIWPMPKKNPLTPVVTGVIDGGDYTVERLHFQTLPGLYLTANLYVPKTLAKPAPAILYVCGHSVNVKDGVSYGAKAGYQHHGVWFARNGYVCLMPDTLQLAEIEGIHHGMHPNKGHQMWWWQSRGYTPAGVEAWNGIRCLDYLQSRPEVDNERIGMTGRSGGGAYTWWTAALDDRVKAAVPVAGITDMHNHVVDGILQGHCDCMYVSNTYRWDYSTVAALIAPRPLLIANSDKDTIFPLDGVYRIHQQVKRIYSLHKADANLGLLITEGPHKDTQDLQVPAFRWFNRFLKKDEGPLADATAPKPFSPEQLRVFGKELPSDQLNTVIQEQFVPKAPAPEVPASKEAWEKQRDGWVAALKSKAFAAWPSQENGLDVKQVFARTEQGVHFRAYEFTSQGHIRLRLYVASPANFQGPESATLTVLDEETYPAWFNLMSDAFPEQMQAESMARTILSMRPAATRPTTRASTTAPVTRPVARRPRVSSPGATPDLQAIRSGKTSHVWFAPRGVGLSAFSGDERALTHLRRKFWLLGQTLEGQQTYDVRRAIQALRSLDEFQELPLQLQSQNEAAAMALYASIFEPNVKSLDLYALPATHETGPHYLNVLKVLDLPAAVAMAAERSEVRLHRTEVRRWAYPLKVAASLQLPKERLVVADPSATAESK